MAGLNAGMSSKFKRDSMRFAIIGYFYTVEYSLSSQLD